MQCLVQGPKRPLLTPSPQVNMDIITKFPYRERGAGGGGEIGSNLVCSKKCAIDYLWSSEKTNNIGE
jgi:hypothetical protein